MRVSWPLITSLLPLLFVTSGSAPLDEGMWLPTEVSRGVGYEAMKAKGFLLEPGALWNENGPSLASAMLMVGNVEGDTSEGIQGFGSASFVSRKGLIVTNHHVAFDALTKLSTPEHNFAKDGFIARTMGDERHCEGLGVQLTTGIEDVTEKILSKLSPELTEGDRQGAIAQTQSELLDAARKEGKGHCAIKDFRLGTRYVMFTYEVFRDVRMVYAPPQSIGEYGGDIDNWMWPRHTGDFTFLRAYVAPDGSRAEYSEKNVPFEPGMALKASLAGIKPGDFCFIMGHPGTTFRFRTSYSIDWRAKVTYPRQITAVEQNVAMLEQRAASSPDQAIKLASTIKSLKNALKNFQGMRDGLKALDVAARRKIEEDKLRKWIEDDEGRNKKWGHVFPALEKLYGRLATGDQGFMQEFSVQVTAVRRDLIEAIEAYAGKALYSDANMTLRVTHGKVAGYSPKDAVEFQYYTTAAGILEKHTGKEPFDAPKDLQKLVKAKGFGRYADATLGTLPVNFLSTTDITGGNSGSPIMNARGELIGLAFDGNYEAMTSDFNFEPDITRTINVDIRYVLWCVDKLAHLDRLLEEMEISGG